KSGCFNSAGTSKRSRASLRHLVHIHWVSSKTSANIVSGLHNLYGPIILVDLVELTVGGCRDKVTAGPTVHGSMVLRSSGTSAVVVVLVVKTASSPFTVGAEVVATTS